MSSSRAEASGIVRTERRNRSTSAIRQLTYQATSRFFLSLVSISRGGGASSWSRLSNPRRLWCGHFQCSPGSSINRTGRPNSVM